jgi:hypothetical protein
VIAVCSSGETTGRKSGHVAAKQRDGAGNVSAAEADRQAAGRAPIREA